LPPPPFPLPLLFMSFSKRRPRFKISVVFINVFFPQLRSFWPVPSAITLPAFDVRLHFCSAPYGQHFRLAHNFTACFCRKTLPNFVLTQGGPQPSPFYNLPVEFWAPHLPIRSNIPTKGSDSDFSAISVASVGDVYYPKPVLTKEDSGSLPFNICVLESPPFPLKGPKHRTVYPPDYDLYPSILGLFVTFLFNLKEYFLHL